MDYKEINRQTLLDALAKLKAQEAPSQLWGRIEDAMASAALDPDVELAEAVTDLREYTPPPQVWNNLSKELDQQQAGKTGLVVQWKKRWPQMVGIAASVLIVAAAGVSFMFREAPPKITKHYSQETVEKFDIQIDWTADQDAFTRIEEEIQQIDSPAINNLRTELEELTSAKSEVQEMVKAYGKDPNLVRQLADIERVRSDIYRQIIALI